MRNRPTSPRALRAFALLAPFAICACSSRQATAVDAAPDLALQRDLATTRDVDPDGPAPVDRGPADLVAADMGCACPAGEVRYHGGCVPTRLLDDCTAQCDADDPASCGADRRCDQWAAVEPDPSCFVSAAAYAACVPRRPAPAGDLRSSPVEGGAGDLATLTIEGGELTIGALMWMARIGDGTPAELGPAGGGACRYEVQLMPPAPGIWPVEVWYGTPDSPPTAEVLLAGFFVAQAGDIPPPTAQPGERCSVALPCAQASPYSCACTSGRCACKR